jgi:hypothetical protein
VEPERKSIASQARQAHVPAVSNRRESPLLGNGSVSTFPWQQINREGQNNNGTVKQGDLYSAFPEVIKELIWFIQVMEQ